MYKVHVNLIMQYQHNVIILYKRENITIDELKMIMEYCCPKYIQLNGGIC